ncbi:MAG: HAMP domain-containing sensor histidine kinase [Pseudomonadota bacterium]|nr:hypothetical protein [Gammaproteobacteria bacterium]MEC8009133.1 HAMP domain-containing sensor histidine kinase [Pseudomonadota bacterium]HBF07975.1 hypothetical protein [Gammaproteobacteria bacterium]
MTLQHRLLRANIIQMIAIAVATLFGVGITAALMEQVLLRTAIAEEAEYFWSELDKNPFHDLPKTKNMIGYLSYDDPLRQFRSFSYFRRTPQVPPHLRHLGPGYHKTSLDNVKRLVYISQHDHKTLYLILDEKEISKLSFFFGVVPLMLSLIGLYLLTWLTQRLFVSTVSPIMQLAKQLEKTNINKPSVLEIPEVVTYKDTEILSLYHSSQKLLDRVQASVAREKRFSRDASHELRTPLAVMKGSLEIIEKQLKRLDLPEAQFGRLDRSVQRAYRASKEMEKLISELLMLAREDYEHVPGEVINANKLIMGVADEVKQAFPDSKVKLKLEHAEEWEIYAPRSVLRVVIMNIATNAMRYTSEGQVTIKTWKNNFEIVDTGEGFDPEFLKHAFTPFARHHHENTQGFGLGLSIVKRFCDHYGWLIQLDSTRGQGSRFRIEVSSSLELEKKIEKDEEDMFEDF